MRPGRLDQRVTLQRVARTRNGIGGSAETWAAFTTTPDVWARVENLSGGEDMDGGQLQATQRFRFTIRNRQDVTEADRLLWRGDPYNIRHVARWGARAAYMMIEAERGHAT